MEVQAVPREPGRDAPTPLDGEQTLVLAFGGAGADEREEAARELGVAFPRAAVVGCSTSGAPSTTAVRFRRVGLRTVSWALPPGDEGVAAVAAFARALATEEPPALVVAFGRRAGSDGDAILAALREALLEQTALAGGLADGGGGAWVLGAEGTGDVLVGVALHGRDLVVQQSASAAEATEAGGGFSLAVGRGRRRRATRGSW
ncbi:MAG: FIST N-terminal domain-containing protein [Myxococcota bacterium]